MRRYWGAKRVAKSLYPAACIRGNSRKQDTDTSYDHPFLFDTSCKEKAGACLLNICPHPELHGSHHAPIVLSIGGF